MRRSLFACVALALVALVACGGADEATADDSELSTDALAQLVVRGQTLGAREAKWMRYVASDVVPHLRGARAERLTTASRAAWWVLKEGDWESANAPGYSLCNGTSGDHHLGPLETCAPRRAWQVGLAGVQVPGHSVADLETLATELYADTPIDTLLERTAALAGYAAGSTESRAIVNSSGALRASWLLRVPAIGFSVVENSEVLPECIQASRAWCYGSGWEETRKFAPTRAAALAAIADIRAILARLAP